MVEAENVTAPAVGFGARLPVHRNVSAPVAATGAATVMVSVSQSELDAAVAAEPFKDTSVPGGVTLWVVARLPLHVNVIEVLDPTDDPTVIAIVSYALPVDADVAELVTTMLLEPVHVVPLAAAKTALLATTVTTSPDTSAPLPPVVIVKAMVAPAYVATPAIGVVSFVVVALKVATWAAVQATPVPRAKMVALETNVTWSPETSLPDACGVMANVSEAGTDACLSVETEADPQVTEVATLRTV